MSEHTKEPWQFASPEDDIDDTWLVMCSGPYEVAHIARRYKNGIRNVATEEANAIRIVACINACAGVETDWLEKCAPIHGQGALFSLAHWLNHSEEFRQQRDAAWAEQKEIRGAINANPEESTADEVRRVAHQRDVLLAILIDLVELADSAMLDANKDGGEYNREEELEEARSAIAKARGES